MSQPKGTAQRDVDCNMMMQVREKDDKFQQRRLDTFFKAAPQTSATSNQDLEVHPHVLREIVISNIIIYMVTNPRER